jgi:membrane protein DedA with SNARE-associated domain
MKPVRFGIYTAIGCVPWTVALAWAGYAVGAHWQSIASSFRGPTYIIAAVVVLALAIAVWRYARRRRAEGSVADDRRPDPAGERPGTKARR